MSQVAADKLWPVMQGNSNDGGGSGSGVAGGGGGSGDADGVGVCCIVTPALRIAASVSGDLAIL